MRAVRRFAPLLLPALCALASCGIPSTGVVEAGGPAGGVVPTVRVYFVADGRLVAVPRTTVAPVGVQSAVELLLHGPTGPERAKRLTTLLSWPLALPAVAPADSAVPARPTADGRDIDGPAAVPRENPAARPVTVTEQDDRVLVALPAGAGKLSELAAAQVICTAVGAQRVADPGSEPAPVTVTSTDGGRVEGTGAQCPDDQGPADGSG